ncbi:GcrA family cell cycle regulator [Falsiroseomonas sp.]|uniref:GcrA family cell cycle regulator n=1 Tax=Falsiroseomonas sp. TaxID=2870721 RepID=UPI002736648B|nr:GcrA family cell cycle regulator [Falsiroseomonas sp.]MDP3414472.1 GcrA family cell cycle regulator [Falsiroseomonas sp.]
MDWTAEAIERLRALWAEGHSTAEIGRRMGISKNAVVGKAHRLNLPARPSPIRREATMERPPQASPARLPRPVAVAARSTLPAAPPAHAAPTGASIGASPAAAPSAPALGTVAPRAPMPAPQPSVVRAFPRFGAARSCCWPIGEPGTPEFRFCSAEATPGKPYCTQHAAVAYVKARDRREDAA